MKNDLFLTLIFLLTFPVLAGAADRADCFPFEKLPAHARPHAEALLLKALDSEALYTIVGGIKPMSSGFSAFTVAVRQPRDEKARSERSDTLAKMEEARRALALWRCGEDELFADLHHFARAFDGRRSSDAVVFNRRSLREMLGGRHDFFDRWAITPSAHPLQVLYAVENAESTARFAGYGYLFGYPDHAVRFFVEAANEEELTGRFVERDFYSIATVTSDTNRFVFAVPKGHKETEADRRLKERAELVLAEYRKRRGEYIGEDRAGVVEMLRDWFCGKDGECSIPRY